MIERMPRIDAALGQLEALPESTTEARFSSEVQATIDELQEIVASPLSDLERFEARLSLGELVLQVTHQSNLEQIDSGIALLRASYEAVKHTTITGLGVDRPAIVASRFGSALTTRAEQVPLADRATVEAEAEEALRFAVDQSAADDPRLPGRMGNLAMHLLTTTRKQDDRPYAVEAVELLHRAIDVANPGSDSSVRTRLWVCLGHAKRKLALATTRDPVGLAPFLDEVERCYGQAAKLSEALGGPDPVSASDRALLASHRFEYLNEETGLNQAIDFGMIARQELDDDDPHRSEAMMQLAEHLLARYELRGDEADLRRAADLSAESVNSYHLQFDGAKRHDLKWRRIEILKTAAAAHGDWGAERRDARLLLDEVLETEGLKPPPETEFLRIEDDLEQARRALGKQRDLADCIDLADRLKELATSTALADERLDYLCRYAFMERRVADSLGFSAPELVDPQRSIEAARLLQAELAERTNQPITSRLYGLISVSDLLAAAAFSQQDQLLLKQAAAAADAALALAPLSDAGLPTVNLVETARLAKRLHRYCGNAQRELESTATLARFSNMLPIANAPVDLLQALPRTRRSIAACVSTSSSDPQQAAWAQLAFSSGLDFSDTGLRAGTLHDLETHSRSSLQLFLSFGRTDGHAVFVSDSQWDQVPLPDLSGDALSDSLVAAYRSHLAAGGGSVKQKAAWRAERARLLSLVSVGLRPLTDALQAAARVDAHLAGWANAVPVVPILAEACHYESHIAAIVASFEGRTGTSLGPEFTFGAIAAPGQGAAGYLAHAIDDAESIANQTGGRYLFEPTTEDAISLLERSRFALYAGHARASHENPGDSALLLGKSELSVRQILSANLGSNELSVFSACESLAPDAQVPENPLSIATAAVFAGAQHAVGSHWRVADEEASRFTALLFEHLHDSEPRAAYSRALAQTSEDSAHFTLIAARPMASAIATRAHG